MKLTNLPVVLHTRGGILHQELTAMSAHQPINPTAFPTCLPDCFGPAGLEATMDCVAMVAIELEPDKLPSLSRLSYQGQLALGAATKVGTGQLLKAAALVGG
jgi:hypothetical protein